MKKLSALFLGLVLASCSQITFESTDSTSLFTSEARAVTQPVKLYFAKGLTTYGVGTIVKGYAEIQSLDYNKEVALWYQANGEGSWAALPAVYVKKIYDKEVWSFETPALASGPDGQFSLKFALRYKVKGQTFWDNNQGANYLLNMNPAMGQDTGVVFGQSLVALNLANAYIYPDPASGNAFVGSAFVKKTGTNRALTLRVTQDGWKSFTDTPATLQETSGLDSADVERWQFSVPGILSATTHIEFALMFTTGTVTTWDNNFGFGTNYHCYRPLDAIQSTYAW